MSGEFHTSEVDLAAFLSCRGLRYLRLEQNPSNGRIADFVFQESPLLYELMRAWGSEEEGCYVDARAFGRKRRQFFLAAQRHLRVP